MVEVAPFRALEFANDLGGYSKLVSPPHDVLSEREIERLRKLSPHNIVHLTLPSDHEGRKHVEPGEHAKKTLQAWVQAGALKPTKGEVLYAYECQYVHAGETRRMRGVVARLRLDPAYKQVLPHEQIFPKFSEDRLKILRATATDLEPIELVYTGRSAERSLWAFVDGSQAPPDLVASAPDGSLHKFWRLSDDAIIGTVVDGFKGRKVYIADGHHRYAAAVRYAAERRETAYRPPKNAPWDYKLALLVHVDEPGLLILPTHRIVRRAAVHDAKRLQESWAHQFHVRTVPLAPGNPVAALRKELEKPSDMPTVGVWLVGEKYGFLLEAKNPVVPEELLPAKSRTLRSLDVVHLQHFALAKAFGIPEEKWGDDVGYTRDDEDAFHQATTKKHVAVLVHSATRLNQMCAIADGGEKMPQKSTYFLPKIVSGIMLYPIGEPAPVDPAKRRVTS